MRRRLLTVVVAGSLIFMVGSHKPLDATVQSTQSACCELPGDVNDDSIVDFWDYLNAELEVYAAGAPIIPEDPPCPEQADVDASGSLTTADLLLLVGYVFQDSPNSARPECP